MSAEVHPLAACDAELVGAGTSIGPFAIIERGARLGCNVTIAAHAVVRAGAELEAGVVVGEGAVVGGSVTLGAGAWVGARVVLAAMPRYARTASRTIVEAGATINDGATIAPGAQLGNACVVMAGAVVDRAVPRHAVVSGNPARISGYVGLDGPCALEPIRHETAEQALEPGMFDTAVRGVQLHRLPEVRDLRGSLVAGELDGRLPFVPRRYFLVFDVPGTEVRGEHAHYACHQFLVAVHGALHVIADDGERRQEFVLDERRTGLYLPPLTWGVQYHQTRDCVLLVLASHPYAADDYIREYGVFLAEVAARRAA